MMKLLALFILASLTWLSVHGLVFDSVYEEEPWRGETIIIFEDGSIYPHGAPIERVGDDTYVLRRDIEVSRGDGIVILRDNIVLDGNGHKIIGDLLTNPRGIFVYYGENVKLVNMIVSGFRYGVIVLGSNNVEVWDIDISGTSYAIVLYESSNSRVVDNTIRDSMVGIYLYWSSGNTIVNNSLIDTGILVYGYTSSNNITNNTINGKQILYLEGASGIEINGDYAQIIIANSRDVRIRGLRLHTPSSASIELVNVTDSIIENNEIANSLYGTYITLSSGILVTKNIFTNTRNCIWLSGAVENRLVENIIINCNIGLAITSISGSRASNVGSRNIVIESNLIKGYGSHGILVNSSSSTRIFNNTITGLGSTSIGVEIASSENTTIIWNTVSRNKQGMLIGDSRLNVVLYNDFLNNNKHVEIQGFVQSNKWDDGGRGNHWDDHPCVDRDNNNICDNPYIIRAPDDVDNYPLRLSAKELIQDPQAMTTPKSTFTITSPPLSPQPTTPPASHTTPQPPIITPTPIPTSTLLTTTPYVTITEYTNTNITSTGLPTGQTNTPSPQKTTHYETPSPGDVTEVPNGSGNTTVNQTLTPINTPVNVTTIGQHEQISPYITIVIVTSIAFMVVLTIAVALFKLTGRR